jgi:hypothetical protein
MGDFPVRIGAPAKVSLFAYDNETLIVESRLRILCVARLKTLPVRCRLRGRSTAVQYNKRESSWRLK